MAITKKQVGVLYGAYKSGKIVCRPEFMNKLYSIVETNQLVFGDSVAILGSAQSIESWKKDNEFAKSLIDAYFAGNIEQVNAEINKWESDMIALCGKKSVWYKYK